MDNLRVELSSALTELRKWGIDPLNVRRRRRMSFLIGEDTRRSPIEGGTSRVRRFARLPSFFFCLFFFVCRTQLFAGARPFELDSARSTRNREIGIESRIKVKIRSAHTVHQSASYRESPTFQKIYAFINIYLKKKVRNFIILRKISSIKISKYRSSSARGTN